MACACKVNQRINEIQKLYGHGKNKPLVKTNIAENTKLILKQFLIYLCCIPFLPFMILYLAWKSIVNKKPIKIDKLFKLKK